MFGIFWFAEGEPKDSKQITKALSGAKGQDWCAVGRKAVYLNGYLRDSRLASHDVEERRLRLAPSCHEAANSASN